MTAILFVCLGNICRSPLAEGIFRDKVVQSGRGDAFTIDSAGTGAWHIGNPPDPRSIAVASTHGIDIASLSARQVMSSDFDRFDQIIAMDRSNLASLRSLQNTGQAAQLRMLLNTPERDVPDPYYGGDEGFQEVYDLLESAMEDLLLSFHKAT